MRSAENVDEGEDDRADSLNYAIYETHCHKFFILETIKFKDTYVSKDCSDTDRVGKQKNFQESLQIG